MLWKLEAKKLSVCQTSLHWSSLSFQARQLRVLQTVVSQLLSGIYGHPRHKQRDWFVEIL